MTTVSRFSRQNVVGLRALIVVPWENLVLVVVLVLESKALYSCEDDGNYDNSYLFYMGFSLAQVHKASMKLKLQHVKSNVSW